LHDKKNTCVVFYLFDIVLGYGFVRALTGLLTVIVSIAACATLGAADWATCPACTAAGVISGC
jgi:hypothetical protein